MSLQTFYPGDPIDIFLTVSDKDGLIDLSTVDEIYVKIFKRTSNHPVLIKRLTKGEVLVTATGVCYVRIERDETIDFRRGIYVALIRTEKDGENPRYGRQDVFQLLDEARMDGISDLSISVTAQSVSDSDINYTYYTVDGVSYRTGVRSGEYVLDKALTDVGFTGIEGTDWEKLSGSK